MRSIGCLRELKCLTLSRGGVKFEGFSVLVELLERSTTINSLCLVDCDIGDQGLVLIPGVLKRNEVIQSLALLMNNITDIGARAIAEVLETTNTTIKFLNLSGN
jgi:NLR family CARD domain-containing protein 3